MHLWQFCGEFTTYVALRHARQLNGSVQRKTANQARLPNGLSLQNSIIGMLKRAQITILNKYGNFFTFFKHPQEARRNCSPPMAHQLSQKVFYHRICPGFRKQQIDQILYFKSIIWYKWKESYPSSGNPYPFFE